MAAVTVAANPPPARHDIGDLIVRYFTISGASGSTLVTGIGNVHFVANQPFTVAGTASLITGISNSNGTLTFTSSAPMVTEVIQVIGRKG